MQRCLRNFTDIPYVTSPPFFPLVDLFFEGGKIDENTCPRFFTLRREHDKTTGADFDRAMSEDALFMGFHTIFQCSEEMH